MPALIERAGARLASLLRESGRYELTEAVFLRLLGLIYIISFASFWRQMPGLVGTNGIVPAGGLLEILHGEGWKGFVQFPTLFWFGISDAGLDWCCVAGCICALLLIAGVLSRMAAAACFFLYLSMVTIGQPFSNFQWDALLLECGFLAIFAGVPLTAYAYRFLLFRLMFESGAVKLLSHDPNWQNFKAMRFHFVTQPLPNPVAYYAYHLPGWVLDGMTIATLVIELFVPFLLFAPWRVRRFAVFAFMLLQVLILVTGNFAFFNLLTLALCFWALDDRIFAPVAGFVRRGALTIRRESVRRVLTVCAGILIVLGGLGLVGVFKPGFADGVVRAIAPFEVVNDYGLFAVMTTSRTELVVEGSDDAKEWRAYEFRYKPGELHRELPVVAPYQPRLDWQMWFAALGSPEDSRWVRGLVYRLLKGEPAVLKLMGAVPFEKPPRYIQILAYDYQFTTLAERGGTGAVWKRRLLGTWFGPVSLGSK